MIVICKKKGFLKLETLQNFKNLSISKQPDKYSKGLSKWIRTKFRTFKSYNEAYASLTKFGTEMKDFQG